MKTMVFIGSPNKNGNTMTLVNEVCKHLRGEIKYYNVFDYLDVKPCVDCGYCHKNYGCIFKDEFNVILEDSFSADCIIIASPMWFGNVSGPMMNFFSRLQTVTSGHIFRKDLKHKFDKAGLLIITAENKWHGMSKTMETTAEFIFNHFDALILDTILVSSTAKLKAGNSENDISHCMYSANKINEWYDLKENDEYYKIGYASENNIRLNEKIGD